MPQTAQAAEQEATYLAAFISKGAEKTPPFEFKEKGQLISLGKCKAAAAIFGIHLSGLFAWWIWRTIYLSKIGGFWNKFQIVTDWTIRLFSHRDITKL
jgi:NADH dehydrogenase